MLARSKSVALGNRQTKGTKTTGVLTLMRVLDSALLWEQRGCGGSRDDRRSKSVGGCECNSLLLAKHGSSGRRKTRNESGCRTARMARRAMLLGLRPCRVRKALKKRLARMVNKEASQKESPSFLTLVQAPQGESSTVFVSRLRCIGFPMRPAGDYFAVLHSRTSITSSQPSAAA
jgi:hypothetical protein